MAKKRKVTRRKSAVNTDVPVSNSVNLIFKNWQIVGTGSLDQLQELINQLKSVLK